MKILVVGAGAIGGYYGARLIQAGADVTFLVRPKRAGQLAASGLQIRSELGNFSGPVATVLREELKPVYDLIVLSCKAYDLDAAMDDFQGAVGPDTTLLPFLNGLSVYDQLDARFGAKHVLGGVAYIAVALDPEGWIRHIGRNDSVIVGARQEANVSVAERFHSLISQSAGTRVLSANVTGSLWNKWVMLASGALMNCLMRGTIAEILATQDGVRLMQQAITECHSVAAAEGSPLNYEELEQLESRLLDPTSAWAASMMRDIAQRAPRVEADAVVGDMIMRAERHGLDTPLVRAAFCHLQVYQRQQTKFS